ncbi:hypothetical protein HUU40_00545 [candidate division KSB1 bacterium]|nr:hypothetical protein [candidate division KSB1 bacterium]
MLREEIESIKTTKPALHKFGLAFGTGLLIIASVLVLKERSAFLYFIFAGIVFTALGLAVPILLKPVYKVWMSFAVVMGFIMTRVILTVIFYGLFTPISLLAKLFGKDLLDEHWDENTKTYWVKRPAASFDPTSAENMF